MLGGRYINYSNSLLDTDSALIYRQVRFYPPQELEQNMY